MLRLWLILISACAAAAQTTTSLAVRLTAPDGAAIERATVRIASASTGFNRVLAAASGGLYSVSNLPLQTYQLTAEAPGFGMETRQIVLRSNVPVTLDI